MRGYGVLGLALCFIASPAMAERGDRDKEIVMLGDKGSGDDKSLVSTLEGDVMITQGTMRIMAAKVSVQKKGDFNYYVASGSPVTYREKRDNLEEWVEGSAERAEFDDRSEVLKLFNRAKVTSGQGEVAGEFISYDTRREVFEVTGAAATQDAAKTRVKVKILPRSAKP